MAPKRMDTMLDIEKGLSINARTGSGGEQSAHPSISPKTGFNSFWHCENLFKQIGHFASKLVNWKCQEVVESSLPTSASCPVVDIGPRLLSEIPRGYPKLAAFLDSDDSFAIYRRFGFLNARLLLNKQDELRSMEDELKMLDEEDRTKDPRALRSRSMDVKGTSRRQTLLSEIEQKFCEYVKLLQLGRDLRVFNRPSQHDHGNIATFFGNYNPLGIKEAQIFCNREDLITLRPGREHAWLDRVVEGCIRHIKWQCIRGLFFSKDDLRKSTESEVYFTRSRIENFVAVMITIMVLILMVVPVYILFELSIAYGVSAASPKAIGVLLVFTLIFSAVLSLFTKARRHEILGATAATRLIKAFHTQKRLIQQDAAHDRLHSVQRDQKTPRFLLTISESIPINTSSEQKAIVKSYILSANPRELSHHPSYRVQQGIAQHQPFVDMDSQRKKGSKYEFYAVKAGHQPGVYTQWSDCLEQVTKYAGAQYKGFNSQAEAVAFVRGELTTDSGKPQAYYAVRSGHVPGIYTSWSEAQKMITGAKRPFFRKFVTQKDAEAFMDSGKKTEAIGRQEPKKSKEPAIMKSKELDSSREDSDEDFEEVDEDYEGVDGSNFKPRPTRPREVDSDLPVTIYTDGSCLGNGKLRSFAGVGVYFGENDPRNISEPLDGDRQTNNRAELTAIIRALESVGDDTDVHIISDSNYAIDCVTVWYRGWENRGWISSKGSPVENKDLIQLLRNLMEARDDLGSRTKLSWVKGHAASAGNEAADRLARGAADNVMRLGRN
ncbi:MAG: hypothetical protein M1814_000036 [Vezdaea aestivalis]|nr:MAG: hypothetical protein M1814_000036 [Vezdaea aestivalis]